MNDNLIKNLENTFKFLVLNSKYISKSDSIKSLKNETKDIPIVEEKRSICGNEPLYYKTVSPSERKEETTVKPTPGPTYYKPIEESSYDFDPYQQPRTVSESEQPASPVPADHDPAKEFGTKSPPSKSEEKYQKERKAEKKTYKSSFKILIVTVKPNTLSPEGKVRKHSRSRWGPIDFS